MKWYEQKVLNAADEASSLAVLIEKNDSLQPPDLKWLNKSQIKKFIEAIDFTEAERLTTLLLKDWSLLDWLWVIGPSSDWKRKYLKTSDDPGDGRQLIGRWAEYEPE